MVTKAPPTKTPFQKWQDTVDKSKTDKRWNDYDSIIQNSTAAFNTKLAAESKGYKQLDWLLIKAMVWVESGGPGTGAWAMLPMQIGKAGDPGLQALLGGKEGGDLILTPAQKELLKGGVSTPSKNILAGTAYLLMRAATYVYKSVPDAKDKRVFEVVVKAGDSLSKIAIANATTIDILTQMNPGASAIIRPGQKLKYTKGAIAQIIVSWKTIDTLFAAQKYNVGDTMYRQKLDYCLGLMSN